MGWPNNYVQGVYDETGKVIGIDDGAGSQHYLKDTNIATKPIKVGMNYMPGWASGWDVPAANGGPWPIDPWNHVLQHNKPLKGEYQGNSQDVIDQQLCEMRDYGVDFIMSDWFFNLAFANSNTDITVTASGTIVLYPTPGYDCGFQPTMAVTVDAWSDFQVTRIGIMSGTVTSYNSTTGRLEIAVTSTTAGAGTAVGVSQGATSGCYIQCTNASPVGADTPVPCLDHFTKGWKASNVVGKPKLCLTWANATNKTFVSTQGFINHIQNAINTYFSDPDYYKIDGKPVLMIIEAWNSTMSPMADSPTDWESLFTTIKANTVAAGYPDLYIVAGISTISMDYWKPVIDNSVVDAVYALNASNRFSSTTPYAVSPYTRRKFADIDSSYFGADDGTYRSWVESALSCMTVKSGVKKIWVPISAGFDTNPWTSSKLQGIPTLSQFTQHLRKGIQTVEDNPQCCSGQIAVQSWSEYLEQSVMEPTISGGFEKLDALRVMASNANANSIITPVDFTTGYSTYPILYVSAGNNNSPTTSATSYNTKGANLIVVAVNWYSAIVTSPPLSDSKGNIWTPLTKRVSGNFSQQLYYCVNPIVGANHYFTLTGSAIYGHISVQAWRTANTVPYDTDTFAVSAGVTTLATGSITPSANGSLIVSALGLSDNCVAPVTVDSGLTITTTRNASAGVTLGGSMAYLVQETAAPVNATWVWTNPSTKLAVFASIVSFKPPV